jgi:hypothetical protein
MLWRRTCALSSGQTQLSGRTWSAMMPVPASIICVVVMGSLLFHAQAEARVVIRRVADWYEFNFHGQYFSTRFSPDNDYAVEIWNCPNGEMPSTGNPLSCYDQESGWIPAQLVYRVFIPAGTCIDRGSSCRFRDRAAESAKDGLYFFRVLYSGSRRSRGNKIWLRSYGDLSLATVANMRLQIVENGMVVASLTKPFRPWRNGGWVCVF